MVDMLTIACRPESADLPSERAGAITAAVGWFAARAAAIKADVTVSGQRFETGIDDLRRDLDVVCHDLKAQFTRARSQLLIWIRGTRVAFGGLIIAIIKL